MKKTIFSLLLLPYYCMAQQRVSTIQEQSNFYNQFHFTQDEQWDSLMQIENGTSVNVPINNSGKKMSSTNCVLNKKVYGWHPYWSGSTVHNNYDWSLISEFCYFDYQVSTSTGNNSNSSFAWSTSAAVTAALTNSVNVHFCATMFSGHSTFFASSTAQQTFITNAINLLNSRGGKGLNIDFEGMTSANKVGFKNFMINLSNQVHAANSNYKVTMALYAVDWNSVFDIPALNPVVDNFIIMGYDYYYSGSSQAGPTAPLYNFATTYNYTLGKSITYYLKLGVTKNKLLLGLPWYGREWETVSATIPSNTTGAYSGSRFFSYVKNNASVFGAKKWDSNSFSPYYTYVSGGNNRQLFIDDNYSLSRKLDMVNQRGLGGIGIWALGYDDGYLDYWNALKNKLSSCAVVECNDSIYDMGGPNRNYYDSESYAYTIAPSTPSKVQLSFSQFDLEATFDSLYLFDGASTSAPLIGSYSGATSPGTITSTGNALTVKFKSDGGTNKGGFKAIWKCVSGGTTTIGPPTTQVVAPTGWITQNFVTNYTDVDNTGGMGLNKSFYQPTFFNGVEWRANASRGFFNDDFSTATIHPDWTNGSGIWAIASGALVQSDENNVNTNIYASVTQTLSNRYLYNFKGTITGTGTNRRAGIHIMCDNAIQTNRGNNYMLYFRPDQATLELYKVTTNTLNIVKTTPYSFASGITYDYKITYDRVSGELAIWVNDVFVTSWIDASPIMIGNSISLRSANCNFKIDNFKIFRSRASSNTILVGATNTNDLRNENISPSTSSGKISSIINDNSNGISSINSQLLNVDWTKPSTPNWIKDGLANDIDTTYNANQLDFNYTAAKDTNSGVASYYYAIGTAAGLQNVKPWTMIGTVLNATVSGLTLTSSQKYYIMLKAKNGATLESDSTVTDGIIYLSVIGIEEQSLFSSLSIFPNPTIDKATISVLSEINTTISYSLIDALGKEVIAKQSQYLQTGLNEIVVNTAHLAKGIYYVQLIGHDNTTMTTRQLIVK